MGQKLSQPRIGVLLSGGIDSAVLLDSLLAGGYCVTPFYVRTGCVWERAEVSAAERFLAAAARPELAGLVVLEMPLYDLYGNHWSLNGVDVPDDTTTDQAVFLPGRNPLLLLKPAIWCWMHNIQHLALATLVANPFADATPEFFHRFEQMLAEATGGQVRITRPLEKLSKERVMEMGRHLPLELTFSCLAPLGHRHCGRCNKCAERQRAFHQLKMEDPTEYAASGTTAVLSSSVAAR
jgi:7-cyano-7-deazaguanine synthase